MTVLEANKCKWSYKVEVKTNQVDQILVQTLGQSVNRPYHTLKLKIELNIQLINQSFILVSSLHFNGYQKFRSYSTDILEVTEENMQELQEFYQG